MLNGTFQDILLESLLQRDVTSSSSLPGMGDPPSPLEPHDPEPAPPDRDPPSYPSPVDPPTPPSPKDPPLPSDPIE